MSRLSRLAVMTALPQEFGRLAKRLGVHTTERIGPREFGRARFGDVELVLVISNVGKVAAATTATLLIDRFGVDAVVFTGVAGGISPTVSIGDIVIADHLIQHDIDLKGVLGFNRFEVPSLKKALIPADCRLSAIAREAAKAVALYQPYLHAVQQLSARSPKVHSGVIGSGDRFVSDHVDKQSLRAAIPELTAVEMEGAAVAQVCAEHERPFVVSRIISDAAADTADVDFIAFIDSAAAVGSEQFVVEFLTRMGTA